MKLHEILTESYDLNEAPLGLLKKAGLGVASKFSSKAAGKLASGNEANEIRKDFDFYIGSSNQQPTAAALMQFLKQEGHPTAGAQKSIALVPGIKQNPAMPLPKNIIDQVFSSIAQSKVSTGQMPAKPTASASKTTPVQQPAVPGYAINNQVKDAVNKMSAKEKQELITHLKTTDKFNQLKFN